MIYPDFPPLSSVVFSSFVLEQSVWHLKCMNISTWQGVIGYFSEIVRAWPTVCIVLILTCPPRYVVEHDWLFQFCSLLSSP